MKVNRLILALAVTVLLSWGGSLSYARIPVTTEEASTWARYTVPLPKSLQILGKQAVSCNRIAIVLPGSSDIRIPQARKELRQALGLPETGENPSNPEFTITLQLGGGESDVLLPLPNKDQAYRIFPEAGDTGLRLVALQPMGLYYAAKTLSQMLPWRVSGGIAEIPIMEVLDWPDMTDRGLWGCDHFLWLKWMSDRKMNIGEQISARSVTEDRVGHSSLKPGRETMVTEGPYYGVKPVPVTLHLEQVWSTGLFTYYPELIGVGGQYGAICYTNGAFTHVLADWICDLASLPYVEGVDVWMAENLHGLGGCQCAQCKLWNRDVLEANTIVAAWNEAKARLGRYFNLWILTSEETYDSNAEVFSAVPSDVRIWYYHSLYTYTSGRTSIISNDVANVAAAGRYAGVCPTISSSGATQPFQSAEFAKYRMNEFISKKLSGYIGYATPPPLVNFAGYNVEAAAEYSWNLNGRSLHEFAASYAVRKGLPDPEKFAEWADATGKLEFDLRGSEWPTCDGRSFPGYVAQRLKAGTLPGLGEAYPGFRGPWGEFKTAQQLDDDAVLAAKALSLAKEMGIAEYWYESLYNDGLISSLRALYKLKGLVVGGTVSPANRETARYYFGVYVNGLKQAISAVQNWNMAVNGETNSVAEVVAKMNKAIYGEAGTSNPGMLQVAADCGCTPNLPYYAVPPVSIAEAKKTGIGAIAKLYGDVASGGYDTTKYIQEKDRSVGIRVSTTSPLTPSTTVAVIGQVTNNNGELVINGEIVQTVGSVGALTPIAMTTRNIGGEAFGIQPGVKEYKKGNLTNVAGLNNLGLLVRVVGRVTHVGTDHFYIDDGANCDDGSGHLGVRVQCASSSFAKPPRTALVRVDGMVSTYYDRGNNWRAIYLPAASNWEVLAPPTEIVVDEHEATFTGSWTYTTVGSGAWENDYKYTTTSASETATARWTPNMAQPGIFDVYVMYSSGADRPTDASYTVCSAGGTQTYQVNQTTGGGTWQLLGRHPFGAGTSGYVQLTNATSTAGKTVIADAVRFVYVGEISDSPPHIYSQPASVSVCAGGSVTFNVAAWGSTPMTYQWRRGNVALSEDGRHSGTTTATLTITNVQIEDAGTDYNCVVTNSHGSETSANASLGVLTAPAAPAPIQAVTTTDSITWKWSPVPNATEYRLWTAATGGTQIGGSIVDTSYTESGLEIGTTYTRYVEAVNSCGASRRVELTATTTPRYCLENGDFESGFTSGVPNKWALTDTIGGFGQETSKVYQGTSSLRMTDPIAGDPFTSWVYQKVNVRPGHNYTLSAYTRREVTNGAVMELGVNYTGGLTCDADYDCVGNAGEWRYKSFSFTAGATGKVTVMMRGGSNNRDTTVYVDLVYLRPQAPTTTGGTATIPRGGSATITAGGGFAGTDNELHWYTGPGGTGMHVGTGTSLVVSPTATTTYYPRWETAVGCPSDDGTPVTITVQ